MGQPEQIDSTVWWIRSLCGSLGSPKMFQKNIFNGSLITPLKSPEALENVVENVDALEPSKVPWKMGHVTLPFEKAGQVRVICTHFPRYF